MDSSEPRPKKGRGGKREGSGRKAGGRNALQIGEVQALKTLRHRVPDGAPPEAGAFADEAFGTIVKVMRGEVSFTEATARLKASTYIREEICGPVAQKLQHSGPDGGPLEVSISINRTVEK